MSAKGQKKMWKKVRDAVNRNGIVRRISIRKSSRVKKYPSSRAPDYEPEEKEWVIIMTGGGFAKATHPAWFDVIVSWFHHLRRLHRTTVTFFTFTDLIFFSFFSYL